MGTWFEKVFLLLPFLALTLCLAVTVSRSSEETSPENGTEQFLFELSENGDFYILTGTTDPDLTEAIIPEEYRQLPVRAIRSDAFMNCSNLSRVVIPDSVTQLDAYLFTGRIALEYVRLSGGMKELGARVPLQTDGWRQASIFGHPVIEMLVIPEGVEIILEYALFGDEIVYKNLILPASLKSIKNNALSSRGIRNVFYCGDERMFEAIEGFDYPAQVYFYSEEKPEVSGLFWHYEDGMPAVWDREEPLLFLPTDDGAGYRVSAAPGVDFREAVIPAEYNGLPVLEIAACGFNGCDSLEAVTFPDSIVKIGTKAFAECSSLKEIQVPEGVTEIGPYAFAWCSGLERAVIPGSVSCLSEGTFYGDTALTDIRMEEGIGEVRFRAFGYCTSLKSVEFPDSVAFMDQPLYICESLEHIRLPENVTYYGDSYEGGSRLMSICLEVHYLDFPDTVTRIGGAAFSLPRLKEMVIPAGLEALYFNAGDFSELERFFYKGTEKQWTGIAAQYPQATVLDEINFPVYFYSEEQPAKLGRYWHYEEGHAVMWTYPDEGFMYLLNRDRTGYVVSRAPGADISGTLVIPDSYEGLPVTDIDICGFQGCSGVTTVVIPDSVVRIGKRAFWGCTGIREMMIPEGVEEIGAEAFAYCTNLRRLALPSSLYRVRLNMITLDETLSFIEIPENAVLLDGFRIYYPWEIPDQARPFPADTVILPSGLLANLCHALRIYPNTEELVEPAQVKTIFYRGDPLQLENEISALNATWRNLLDFWETTFYCYSETEPEEEGLFWHYENGQAQPWE